MRTDAATSPLLSPELALVDPTLAGAARASMPPGGDGEAWRMLFPTRPLAATAVLVVAGESPQRRSAPGLRMLVGAGVLCAAATAVAYGTGDSDRPYLVDPTPPRDRETIRPAPPGGVAATSIAIRTTPTPTTTTSKRDARPRLPVRVSPRAQVRRLRPVRSVVRLGWSARPEATYYRVRIRRATARATAPVLEIWTVGTSIAVQLGRGKNGPDARLLAPGRYRWTVHTVSARRFGEGAPSTRAVAGGEFSIGRP